MSIGNASSALGTLLVQRLDAVLGTTLSQQSNLVSGARPDAVSQPGQTDRGDPARNDVQRHPQDNVNRAAGQVDAGRKQVGQARNEPGQAANLRGAAGGNASTQTNLGVAARIILDLLNHYPEQMPVQSRTPLMGERPGAGMQTANGAGNAGQAPATGTGPASQGSAPAAAPQAMASAAAQAAPTRIASLPGVLPSADGTASLFAQALSRAIQGSGVFYESHLAQLAFGERSADSLRQEPQNQAQTSANDAGKAGAERAAPSSQPQPGPASQASAGQTGHAASGAANTTQAPLSSMPGIAPETQLIVRQQLETLANQAFSWRGEAWPDADMEWDVQRRNDTAPDGTDHWATRIALQLPVLGHVQARLTLAGAQLVMHVEAPDAARQLSEHAPALRQRLSAVGLSLTQLSIAASDTAVGAGIDPFGSAPASRDAGTPPAAAPQGAA